MSWKNWLSELLAIDSADKFGPDHTTRAILTASGRAGLAAARFGGCYFIPRRVLDTAGVRDGKIPLGDFRARLPTGVPR